MKDEVTAHAMSKRKPRGIVLADFEARALIDGMIADLLRPIRNVTTVVDGVPYGSCGKGTRPRGTVGARIDCSFAKAGDEVFGQEAWASWEDTCDDAWQEEDHEHDASCHHVYVAYRSTPRVGYRPTPDRARIRYLDETSPLSYNRRLLGPWRKATSMPHWASRIHRVVERISVKDMEHGSMPAVREHLIASKMLPKERWCWRIELARIET